jgi:hypothetical protein
LAAYWHKEAEGVAAIVDFIASKKLTITVCNLDGTEPRAGDVGTIAEMMARSDTLWGTDLRHFVRISEAEVARTASLADSVGDIEASTDADTFRISAYADGGLISVSGTPLPFQKTSHLAPWWRPPRKRRWFWQRKK